MALLPFYYESIQKERHRRDHRYYNDYHIRNMIFLVTLMMSIGLLCFIGSVKEETYHGISVVIWQWLVLVCLIIIVIASESINET